MYSVLRRNDRSWFSYHARILYRVRQKSLHPVQPFEVNSDEVTYAAPVINNMHQTPGCICIICIRRYMTDQIFSDTAKKKKKKTKKEEEGKNKK